jgi:hypothetical protein
MRGVPNYRVAAIPASAGNHNQSRALLLPCHSGVRCCEAWPHPGTHIAPRFITSLAETALVDHICRLRGLYRGHAQPPPPPTIASDGDMAMATQHRPCVSPIQHCACKQAPIDQTRAAHSQVQQPHCAAHATVGPPTDQPQLDQQRSQQPAG